MTFDVSVIRPAIHKEDITFRGRQLSVADLSKVKKALRTLHSLEIMATNIYRFQLTRHETPLNLQLLAAMCNEQTHASDFLVHLYEYGLTPSPFRWAWWIVGFVFGFGSRFLGTKMILKTGIWVESKAVHHYAQLLAIAAWDERTRHTIEKNKADESEHIRIWRKLLNQLQSGSLL